MAARSRRWSFTAGGAVRRRTSAWTCARRCTPSTRAHSGARRSTASGTASAWCWTIPFLVAPYRTADGRWVMASGVCPHLAAKWCRFLDVPPDVARVAAAVARWDASELEEEASVAGLPVLRGADPDEWLAHEQGALLADQPVIGLTRIGDAPSAGLRASRSVPSTAFGCCRSRTRSPGLRVGRTLAEQGADVLCCTRPNDYEHEFIYAEANVGSRSAYVDLDSSGRTGSSGCAPRRDRRRCQQPSRRIARASRTRSHGDWRTQYPGIVYVSVNCYGPNWTVGAIGAAST